MIKGKLDIKLIKTSERKGINDAVIAIKKADLNDVISLRGLFHMLFKTIYRDTSYAEGNKFYWYGRDRVIQMLRTFRASTRKFMLSDAKFYDIDGEEFKLDTTIDADTVQRVYESLDYLHQRVVEYEEINISTMEIPPGFRGYGAKGNLIENPLSIVRQDEVDEMTQKMQEEGKDRYQIQDELMPFHYKMNIKEKIKD